MKKSLNQKRTGLILLFTGLFIGLLVAGVFYWQKGPVPSNVVASDTEINESSTLSKAEAQAIINQTVDKKTIPKAVWLASGMSELEYNVIWEAGTERPGTSPLNDEKRPGKFVTKACGLEVFSSDHKYESGTGWPSFYEANKENLVLKEDYSWLGIKRIEVESKCGEHLGHVFEDGPEPTGLRYCMNGAALVFVPEE